MKLKTALIPPMLCAPQTQAQRRAVGSALSRIFARHCREKNAKHANTLILAPHMDQ